MKSCIAIAFMLSIFLAPTASAEMAVRDDGRKVKLKEDGSWELVSSNVYATTQSGQRVILESDGTWTKVAGDKPMSITMPQQSVTQLARSASHFAIRDIIVEKVELKRGGSAKGAVLDHRSLVTLDILEPIDTAKLEPRFFTLTDDKGGNYPVISLEPQGVDSLVVVAEGAPSRLFSRIKNYELKVDQTMFGASSDITLIYDYRDVETVSRHEFSY